VIGVYVMRDAEGRAVYVGSSADIDKRIATHAAQAPWWPQVDTVERIEVSSRALAFHRERELIDELKPERNRMSANGRKARSRDAGPVVRPRPEALAALIDAYGSVAALARAVGCDHMTMSDIWRGTHYPSTKVVARLIVVSGIPFDELFYIDPQEAAPSQWLSRKERGAA
jgi:predicted GIY-YIG superfamily endonuclease